MLNKAEKEGKISGMQFLAQGPSIHHLLFAEDSLFICMAEEIQCREFKKIMSIYEAATGQTINLDKSAITFGENVDIQIKESIQQYLGILKKGGTGNYLGLPECFSGSKVEMLAYIKENIKSRISGWFARTLSLGGKEILLKFVVRAMPIYAMSCFKLPKTTCFSLSSAMADFWWHSVEDKRKVHWIGWDKLCLTKQEGGMGFRDIECFNQALLGKQAWKIIQNPKSLWARFLKSRYHDQGDFIQAVEGLRPSYGWRSILHGRSLLLKGMTKMIGDRSSISVWMSLGFVMDYPESLL